MHIEYKPADGDAQTWNFCPDNVKSSEAIRIEQAYDEPWDEFVGEVQRGQMEARRLLLWHLLSQTHPTLRVADVPDFTAGQLVVHFSTAELEKIRTRNEQTAMPARRREKVLAMIDRELAEAEAREGQRRNPGKALSSGSSTSGGSSSPSS